MSRASVAIGVVVAALLLSGCAAQPSYADRLAERTIVAVADDVMPPYPEPEDAESLADRITQHSRFPPEEGTHFAVEVLDWAGNSGDPEGARVDVRIDARVEEHQEGSKFNTTLVEADHSTRCWHLTLFGFRNYDTAEVDEFDCPEGAAAKDPVPAPREELPQDLEAVLPPMVDGADTATLGQRLHERFPGDGYTIEVAEEGGVLVGALGVPAEDQCVLVVRPVDGAAYTVGGFARELLQPGEMGCSPELHFRPVTTH